MKLVQTELLGLTLHDASSETQNNDINAKKTAVSITRMSNLVSDNSLTNYMVPNQVYSEEPQFHKNFRCHKQMRTFRFQSPLKSNKVAESPYMRTPIATNESMSDLHGTSEMLGRRWNFRNIASTPYKVGVFFLALP
jgi:hypothetical protein